MSQNKDIPHADLIRAVLDGKVVEYKSMDNDHWYGLGHAASTISALVNYPHWQYRLKPEPHKWQREMDAQAAGKMIQYRDDEQTWTDGASLKFTSKEPGAEYRIKPEPVTKAQALTTFLKITSGATWNPCDKEVVRRFIEESNHD